MTPRQEDHPPHDHWCIQATSGRLRLEQWTDHDWPAWRLVDTGPLEPVVLADGNGPADAPLPSLTWSTFLGSDLRAGVDVWDSARTAEGAEQ